MAQDVPEPDDQRVADRADLLPEEQAAGSADPRAQAQAILEESDERLASRDAAPDSRVEHRTSDEVTGDPGGGPDQ
jgi:hypothetical protein